MNVSISDIEAARLAAVSGKPLTNIKGPVRHQLDEFSGVPCPFLEKDSCTVYESRPFACRAHYSFDISSYWCHPERSNKVEMSLLKSEGAEQAYLEIVKNTRLSGFADIRDFFLI